MARTATLRPVRQPEGVSSAPDLGAEGDLGDLALIATIFLVSVLPLLGALAHFGHWGEGEVGLGTVGALLAGRELWAWARAALRAGRRFAGGHLRAPRHRVLRLEDPSRASPTAAPRRASP